MCLVINDRGKVAACVHLLGAGASQRCSNQNIPKKKKKKKESKKERKKERKRGKSSGSRRWVVKEQVEAKDMDEAETPTGEAASEAIGWMRDHAASRAEWMAHANAGLVQQDWRASASKKKEGMIGSGLAWAVV